MLVEAGPSVYFLEAGHIQATHALLAGLSAGDRVAVAKYDTSPQMLLDFTSNKQLAEAALAKVRYYMGFGNLNLSRSLLAVLDSLAKVQGKKTVVLLSTGFDTSYPEDISALLVRLKTSDVRILAVSLGAELRNPPAAPKRRNNRQATKRRKKQSSHSKASPKPTACSPFSPKCPAAAFISPLVRKIFQPCMPRLPNSSAMSTA